DFAFERHCGNGNLSVELHFGGLHDDVAADFESVGAEAERQRIIVPGFLEIRDLVLIFFLDSREQVFQALGGFRLTQLMRVVELQTWHDTWDRLASLKKLL